MEYIIAMVIGYGLGCIQAGFLISKFILGKDIRDFGNGNAGASNATMVFGRRVGIATALIDIIKGIMAILITGWIYKGQVEAGQLWNLYYLAGTLAVLGHNFPFYMGFRGGKGTATALGILFGLDYRLGLIGFLTMTLVILITDYMVLGTVGLLVVMIVYTGMYHLDLVNMSLVLLLTVMSLYKHRKNFIRLKNGTEKHVKSTLFKKK